jgi:hypothetical protein
MRYAHFFNGTARKPATLVISETPALNSGVISEIPVAGRRDARVAAKLNNATPWNF